MITCLFNHRCLNLFQHLNSPLSLSLVSKFMLLQHGKLKSLYWCITYSCWFVIISACVGAINSPPQITSNEKTRCSHGSPMARLKNCKHTQLRVHLIVHSKWPATITLTECDNTQSQRYTALKRHWPRNRAASSRKSTKYDQRHMDTSKALKLVVSLINGKLSTATRVDSMATESKVYRVNSFMELFRILNGLPVAIACPFISVFSNQEEK